MPKQFVGEHCQRLGLKTAVLLQSFLLKKVLLSKFPPPQITNGLILELFKLMNNEKFPWACMYWWLEQLYGDEFKDVSNDSIISALAKKHRKLTVSHLDLDIADLCDAVFKLPQTRAKKSIENPTTVLHVVSNDIFLTEHLEAANLAMKDMAEELCKEKLALQIKNEECVQMKSKLSRYNTRNVHKREKRKDITIKELKTVIKEQSTKVAKNQQELQKAQNKAEKEEKSKCIYKSRWARLKAKQNNITADNACNEELIPQCDCMHNVELLKDRITELELINSELIDERDPDSNIVKCFEQG